MFTPETTAAIRRVAEICAQDYSTLDFGGETPDPAEVLAELALDANRLTFWGYPEADAEVHTLVDQNGWDAVLVAAARVVPTP